MARQESADEPTMLPESLEKLQIMSNNQKLSIIGYNPFDLSNVPTPPTNINLEEELFGPKCNHHKMMGGGKKDKIEQNFHQIRHQKPNKGSNKIIKKLFREPILHYLNGNYSSSYANNPETLLSESTSSSGGDGFENFPSSSSSSTNDTRNSNKNHIDFKTLVNECANLTLSSSSTSSLSGTMIDCKSESFKIMQKPTIKRDGQRTIGKFPFSSSTTNSASTYQQSQLIRSQSIDSLSMNDMNNNVNSNNGNLNSTSCSQQALLSPCDITCDELASYFETFVYIPKKMSTMADAMYI